MPLFVESTFTDVFVIQHCTFQFYIFSKNCRNTIKATTCFIFIYFFCKCFHLLNLYDWQFPKYKFYNLANIYIHVWADAGSSSSTHPSRNQRAHKYYSYIYVCKHKHILHVSVHIYMHTYMYIYTHASLTWLGPMWE